MLARTIHLMLTYIFFHFIFILFHLVTQIIALLTDCLFQRILFWLFHSLGTEHGSIGVQYIKLTTCGLSH